VGYRLILSPRRLLQVGYRLVLRYCSSVAGWYGDAAARLQADIAILNIFNRLQLGCRLILSPRMLLQLGYRLVLGPRRLLPELQ
jgi:hypothetical protein